MNRILKISFLSISILFLSITIFQSTASARTIFVSPSGNNDTGASWETAFTTITAGLTASASGDEIWVRSATYTESIEMKEGVALYGGFTGSKTTCEERDWDENETVIDASELDISVVIGANDAVLDGFTVTGGGYGWDGAGLYCMGTSPSIYNCTITRNHENGVYCENASPNLFNCVIEETEGGSFESGVSCVFDSSPTLVNCIIQYNQGGGLYCDFSSPQLINCQIINNVNWGGGGVSCWSASPSFTNCVISGNWVHTSGGGVYAYESSLSFTNCLIVDNYAQDNGGGFYLRYRSSLNLVNCTIASNCVAGDGGGAFLENADYHDGSNLTLTNCILWNRGKEISIPSSEFVSARYCCVQGGWPGDGNIDAYPLFANAEAGVYKLRYTSPCIDRGLVSEAPMEDIDGQPRPGSDGLVDIGAYEISAPLTPGPANHVPTRRYVRSDVSTSGDGASWATAFSSISSALEIASTSDEIWVQGGTYRETIAMEPSVAIYGGFAGNESKRGDRDWRLNESILNGCCVYGSVVVGAKHARLDGFSVIEGYSVNGGAVFCWNTSPVLANCKIQGNSAYWGSGLYCIHSSPRFENCLISDNSSEGNGGLLYCDDRSSPTLVNCTIANNVSAYASGVISCYDHSFPVLTNCILWNRGREIYADLSSTPDVQYCCVQGGWSGEGNINVTPLFADADSGDYHLQDGSPCIDRGLISAAPAKDLDGVTRPGSDGLVDMGAYESAAAWEPGSATHVLTRWYVRGNVPVEGNGKSWDTAFSSLTLALDVASVSDEIWVQGGTYNESIVMEPGVAIYGGFKGDESNREDRNWRAYETIIDATGLEQSVVFGADNAILDGFTVTGGYHYFPYGGGLSCVQSSPRLNNCKITGNYSRDGGGVYLDNSNPVFMNCLIENNTAENEGGGINSFLSSPTLINCSIIGNTANNRGDGFYCFYYDNPIFKNCIFWNDGDEFVGNSTEEVSITYSCIEGGWPGEGNIDCDPMFVRAWDGKSGDYRLRPGSPCIDAGTPVPELTTDLAGNLRPVDIPGVGKGGTGAYDMGAYERQAFDVGDVHGKAFLVYSALWQRGKDSAPPVMNETEYQVYNAWDDDSIDWKDILNALDVGRD